VLQDWIAPSLAVAQSWEDSLVYGVLAAKYALIGVLRINSIIFCKQS
jgi:hypothetical protein